jgi:hypothetical protein
LLVTLQTAVYHAGASLNAGAVQSQDAPLVKPEPGVQLQVAPDEFACCDLTEEDAAPSWQVQKKPRIALD